MRYVLPFLGRGANNGPTSWAFTYSSKYDTADVPTQANMSDANSYTFWANNAEANAFLQADFGSVKTLTSISYRAIPVDAPPGGWGASFTDGKTLQYSEDGSVWTNVLTISASSTTTTTLYTLPVPVAARYVRFFYAPPGYIGISEFYFG